MYQVGNAELAKCGLSQQHFVVLKEIQERGPVSQKDLASDLLLRKSYTSKIVSFLLKKRLIAMKHSKVDRRYTELIISKTGLHVVNVCMRNLNIWNDNWLRDLSDKEVTDTLVRLNKLTNLIKN